MLSLIIGNEERELIVVTYGKLRTVESRMYLISLYILEIFSYIVILCIEFHSLKIKFESWKFEAAFCKFQV